VFAVPAHVVDDPDWAALAISTHPVRTVSGPQKRRRPAEPAFINSGAELLRRQLRRRPA
jgi:hypothetical protein